MKPYIKQVAIPVRNQDRSLEFYTKKLGFEVATDAPMGGDQRWIELRTPGHEAKLVLFTHPEWKDRIGTFSNIMFSAEDVEKTCRELEERGVEFVQRPKKESWGISAIFKDIDGNTFSIGS